MGRNYRHRTRRVATQARLPVLLALVPLLATGCGSSDPSTRSEAPALSETTAQTTSTGTASSSFSNSVTGTTSDQQGNSATITVAAGTPEPLSKASAPAPSACNQAIEADGQSVSDAVAIPLRVTATLTSSLKAPIDVDLANVTYLPQSPDGQRTELWAASYSNSEPQCPTTAEAKWAAEALTPNTPASWEPWLVIVGAITPNDPSGEQIVNRILFRPAAGVGSGNGDGDLTPQGSGWVRCSVDESIAGPHSEPYLAVDPTTARAEGCTASG
jgi:hypothetical protein